MIQDYLKAGYPALCVLTQEPHRAEGMLVCDDWRFFAWDTLTGIREAATSKVVEEVHDPVHAVSWLNDLRDTVLITHNLHLYLESPELIQAIQNGVAKWKSTGCCLVMVSPVVGMPPELDKFFHVIDLPLPDTESLYDIQCDMGRSVNVKPNKKAARAAKGLTEFESETAYALSLVKTGHFNTKVVSEAKAQMIRRSQLMEFWPPADIGEVGGLNRLKEFIINRAKAYLPENSHLPKPKGILLVGVPGTAKSLISKAAASILGWPLIKFDPASTKGSLVGESERKMREATKVIDAFGEAVLFLDEIEKSFAGARSSGDTDSGVSSALFGHFISWMADSTSSVLIMATANNISNLPPEFMRAGRFDATFFVDLPTTSERIEIIRIMNRKYKASIPIEWTDRLTGYTGAEIEQLAKDSLFDGLDAAFDALVPLSKTMREDIQALKDWAKSRARLANSEEEGSLDTRKIRSLPPQCLN